MRAQDLATLRPRRGGGPRIALSACLRQPYLLRGGTGLTKITDKIRGSYVRTRASPVHPSRRRCALVFSFMVIGRKAAGLAQMSMRKSDQVELRPQHAKAFSGEADTGSPENATKQRIRPVSFIKKLETRLTSHLQRRLLNLVNSFGPPLAEPLELIVAQASKELQPIARQFRN